MWKEIATTTLPFLVTPPQDTHRNHLVCTTFLNISYPSRLSSAPWNEKGSYVEVNIITPTEWQSCYKMNLICPLILAYSLDKALDFAWEVPRFVRFQGLFKASCWGNEWIPTAVAHIFPPPKSPALTLPDIFTWLGSPCCLCMCEYWGYSQEPRFVSVHHGMPHTHCTTESQNRKCWKNHLKFIPACSPPHLYDTWKEFISEQLAQVATEPDSVSPQELLSCSTGIAPVRMFPN
jgi:hypothetical protein